MGVVSKHGSERQTTNQVSAATSHPLRGEISGDQLPKTITDPEACGRWGDNERQSQNKGRQVISLHFPIFDRQLQSIGRRLVLAITTRLGAPARHNAPIFPSLESFRASRPGGSWRKHLLDSARSHSHVVIGREMGMWAGCFVEAREKGREIVKTWERQRLEVLSSGPAWAL